MALLVYQVYDAGSGVLPLPKASVRSAEQLYESLDAATSGWLHSCRALLDSLSAWPDLLVTHVVVGGSQLVPLLAKLLLARLDSCVGLTQVRWTAILLCYFLLLFCDMSDKRSKQRLLVRSTVFASFRCALCLPPRAVRLT
jgi:hypothetical protein